jgi:hypothetical protein
MNIAKTTKHTVSGEFVTLMNERFYAIRNSDKMAPFFISVVSNSDHWLFVSSTGGLTAGRVSPETPLFPYVTVDKIHESTSHTGTKTLVSVNLAGINHQWEPFNKEHDGRYKVTRNIYKNVLGNKLCFEEINHDLKIRFCYTWATSEKYGFVRQCQLENLSNDDIQLEMIDGFQNVLPAGTPRFTQTNSSNLVDAYKWTELDPTTGLAFFTLYSGITDKAEPCESLKANTIFSLGLPEHKVLLSSEQLDDFRQYKPLQQENHKRGIRGAYLVNCHLSLAPKASQHWQLVANVEQSQNQVVALRNNIRQPEVLEEKLTDSIANGSDELTKIMAGGDSIQKTAEEAVTVHHYANVLFNILRGGAFDEQYSISAADFSTTIKLFNTDVFNRHQSLLESQPEKQDFTELLAIIQQQNDPQLTRLCYEYLPISFGRRHGDPSRPWNQFAIKLVDDNNNRLLTYQGNWRDIFQNWEALTFSYPEFIENIIVKFVNASTIDGYNPYRITKEGIDWEVEEPDDPWSYIGYWGDHQIIYLEKMLELSQQFHPERLSELLRQQIFSYANVPYRIKSFDALVKNAKDTVEFDQELADQIDEHVANIGADGKLILDVNANVYQVNLLEKLLVTLLCKLSNLVIDGGIWLNTQRPEWNDANNALVGQGLSMVTLSYLRRYIDFLQTLLNQESGHYTLSNEVATWLNETAATLAEIAPSLGKSPLDAKARYESLVALGESASRYRQRVYQQGGFSGVVEQPLESIHQLLKDALVAIDHTIANNQREDQLYHAYNLLEFDQNTVNVDTLYPMLEGQVAALSAGVFDASETVKILTALFESDIYRADQETFMLYPDRQLPSFLTKNQIPAQAISTVAALPMMIKKNDQRIILLDDDGCYRFNADLNNAGDLKNQLDALSSEEYDLSDNDVTELLKLYESVFNHQAFTGRSGGMFGFEGLGSIYWHMVSKLLLAVKENYFTALENNENEVLCQQLADFYYRIRQGIGFNKTPLEYGAFPTDPYSHTPKHAGAQQPGMTGQVKEEILTRFGELGLQVSHGQIHFLPKLLRKQEFIQQASVFSYLDTDTVWKEIQLAPNSLAFTYCQVPVVYQLNDEATPSITVLWQNGEETMVDESYLYEAISANVFMRNGRVQQLTLTLTSQQLLN